MTEKEIAQAVRRADADALRHQLEDSKIVLCEAGIALHRRYGWGSKRIGDFIDMVQEVEDECSADPRRSMIQILDEETGIEIKPDADGPGWRDLAFLNADIEHQCKSIPEYRCMRSRQIRWIKPTFYALVFVALHRKCGWGAERMRRLLTDMQGLGIRSSKQARKLYKQEIGVALEVRQE